MKAGDEFLWLQFSSHTDMDLNYQTILRSKKKKILFKLMLHKNSQKQFLNPLIFPFRLDHLTQMFVFKI